VNTKKGSVLRDNKRVVLNDIQSDINIINDLLNRSKDMEVKIHYARLLDLLEHTVSVIKDTKEVK
jgi:hypothetical protein